MSSNKISPELKVGIVVLVSILILFYMSFRIGKFGAFRERGYEITVTFANANGLDPRSPVQIAGVEVGKVKKIALDAYKATLTLTIKEGVKVPADSKIIVKAQGLLGDKYIEILPGTEKKFLAQGDRVNDVIPGIDFNEVFTQINVAAKNFGETMGEFKDILGDREKENIKKSIANIESLSGDFRTFMTDNKGNITRVVNNTAVVSEKLSSIAQDIEQGKGTLGLLVKDDKLYNDAKDTVASLKSISKDIEEGKGTLGKFAKDETLYNDTKEAVSNIKDLTDGIKKGEGTLGKLAKDDSLYNETEKAMKKIQKGAEGLEEITPVTILGTVFGFLF